MLAMAPILCAQNAQAKPSQDAELERLKLEAQQRQELEQRDWQTKIFEIKYVQPYALRQALSMFRASMNPDFNSRILAIKAPKEIMPAIEDAIKRLDVPTPRKDAELTVFILMGSDQPESTALPAGLQPVVNELKKVLAYKGYQLIDTLMARGGDSHDISLTGALASQNAGSPGTTGYSLSARLNVENAGLRINNLRFVLNVPNPVAGSGATNVSINTDVEIPPGQQVVVGKATFVDKAFILVMTAKF